MIRSSRMAWVMADMLSVVIWAAAVEVVDMPVRDG